MTILFFLRPKNYDVGGLNRGFLSGLFKKKEEKKEEVYEEITYSDELIENVEKKDNLIELEAYIQESIKEKELKKEIEKKIKIQQEVLRIKKLELQKLVEEMKEEEDALSILLILND